MKELDDASTGRTYERAGAQFICSSSDGCDITLFSQPKATRTLAGDLLEEVGAWSIAIRDLPPDYEIPAGVVKAIEDAYRAALAWVEFLDRATKTPDELPQRGVRGSSVGVEPVPPLAPVVPLHPTQEKS